MCVRIWFYILVIKMMAQSYFDQSEHRKHWSLVLSYYSEQRLLNNPLAKRLLAKKCSSADATVKFCLDINYISYNSIFFYSVEMVSQTRYRLLNSRIFWLELDESKYSVIIWLIVSILKIDSRKIEAWSCLFAWLRIS